MRITIETGMKYLAKSHGILLSDMEFYQFCPQIVPNLFIFLITEKLSISVESPHFSCFLQIEKRDGHVNLRNGHGKVMEKYFVKSVGTLV